DDAGGLRSLVEPVPDVLRPAGQGERQDRALHEMAYQDSDQRRAAPGIRGPLRAGGNRSWSGNQDLQTRIRTHHASGGPDGGPFDGPQRRTSESDRVRYRALMRRRTRRSDATARDPQSRRLADLG